MKAPAIALLICVGLAAASASHSVAQSKQSPSASKPQLSEIRELVHKLQGYTEKLQDLMTQYRSLLEQRPQGNDTKWSAALDRLLVRVDTARATVVEAKQRLDQLVNGQTLSTALGKDVANTQNEADAQRADAEQALAKRKPAARAAKPAKKPASEPTDSPELDDL
jgi:hypothetical protein